MSTHDFEQADPNPLALSEADAGALDALVNAGFGAVRGPEAERAGRITSLLRVLDDAPVAVDRALVDAALARVVREQSADAGEAAREVELERSLSVDDEEALDAYVSAGFDLSRVTGALRERAARIDAMRGLVVETPTGLTGGQLLMERTAHAVAQLRRERPVEVPRGRVSGPRLADLIGVAAVLLLGASVFLPIAGAWTTRRERVSCAGNMASLAGAFGQYTQDYRGELPIASAWRARQAVGEERHWLGNTGKDPSRSNSANLFTLARAGYTRLGTMACSGNDHAVRSLPGDARDWQNLDQVSYSYYVMFGDERPDATAPGSTIVLADRSPVISRVLANQPAFPLVNSSNHDGSGQWALRLDGSAVFARSPVVNGDNIWLPANLEEVIGQIRREVAAGAKGGTVELPTRREAAERREQMLRGLEAPASARDVFLGP